MLIVHACVMWCAYSYLHHLQWDSHIISLVSVKSLLTHWGCHFPDDIFKCIFLMTMFVHRGPVDNIPTFVQIMAWRWPGDKPLSEKMMVSLLTHIYVTRPQWVNGTGKIPVTEGTIPTKTRLIEHLPTAAVWVFVVNYSFFTHILVVCDSLIRIGPSSVIDVFIWGSRSLSYIPWE